MVSRTYTLLSLALIVGIPGAFELLGSSSSTLKVLFIVLFLASIITEIAAKHNEVDFIEERNS